MELYVTAALFIIANGLVAFIALIMGATNNKMDCLAWLMFGVMIDLCVLVLVVASKT